MWNLTREEQGVFLFLIAVFLVGMGIKLWGGIPYSPELPPSEESVRVKISGAVKEPGWYELAKGNLVIEGIKKAGGALPQADLRGLNLGSSLKDEKEIWVPGEKIDINRAPPEQLTYLPGIGPVLAKRIIEYREQNNGFQDISELQNVPGIGQIKFQEIKDKITLGDSTSLGGEE